MKKFVCSLLFFGGVGVLGARALAQQEIPLYGSEPIPNSRQVPDREKIDTFQEPLRYSIRLVSHPTLTVYLPALGKGNGTAVIVCPGGAYRKLSMTGEGSEVGKWLSSLGITAFVLKYRLPSDQTMIDKTIGPLQDAQRAIQVVRSRAGEWGVQAGRIGMLGFSAGGHLAAMAGTCFQQPVIENRSGVSLRPDFMILLYPVVSFSDSLTHMGSRDSLVGVHPSAATITAFSVEKHITGQTPPAFIVHAEDDPGVPVANSLYLYEAMVKKAVPAELLIYPAGGHGFGMHNPSTNDEWTIHVRNWLVSNGWLGSGSPAMAD